MKSKVKKFKSIKVFGVGIDKEELAKKKTNRKQFIKNNNI
jgi:hypothetical protein